jgi:hypothetical protein
MREHGHLASGVGLVAKLIIAADHLAELRPFVERRVASVRGHHAFSIVLDERDEVALLLVGPITLTRVAFGEGRRAVVLSPPVRSQKIPFRGRHPAVATAVRGEAPLQAPSRQA